MSKSSALQKRRRKLASLRKKRADLALKLAQLQDMIAYAESGELGRAIPPRGRLRRLAATSLTQVRRDAITTAERIADLDQHIKELESVIAALRSLPG
jgi:hypothetical protein